MANWTPEGFVGHMLRAHTSIVPPPPGVPSPLEWGKEDVVRARFGDRVTSVTCTRRTLELRFPFPPAAVTELFARASLAEIALISVIRYLRAQRIFVEHGDLGAL